MFLVLLLIFAPVAWLFISSISPRVELLATPPHWIPENPTLDNYRDVLFPGEDSSRAAKDFRSALTKHLAGWRMACALAMEGGVAIPAMSSALSFFHSMTTDTLPANLIQAQRDYFGAHMYRRKDKPKEELFHTEWVT